MKITTLILTFVVGTLIAMALGSLMVRRAGAEPPELSPGWSSYCDLTGCERSSGLTSGVVTRQLPPEERGLTVGDHPISIPTRLMRCEDMIQSFGCGNTTAVSITRQFGATPPPGVVSCARLRSDFAVEFWSPRDGRCLAEAAP